MKIRLKKNIIYSRDSLKKLKTSTVKLSNLMRTKSKSKSKRTESNSEYALNSRVSLYPDMGGQFLKKIKNSDVIKILKIFKI
jgi:hypothetical protein